MAERFNVSIGAVLAVQSPSHFDLPYRKDWKGMKFGHLLNDFIGPVRLMHGSDSGVCTMQQVKELQREFPKAQVLEVTGAAHPVPFNAAVNRFVLKALNLPAVAPVVAPQALQQPVVEAKPASPPQAALAPSPVQPRVGLLGLIKQLLGATKK